MNSIRTFGRPYTCAYYGRKQIKADYINRVVYANQNKELALSISHGGRSQQSIVSLEMGDAGASYNRRNIIKDALVRLGVRV